MAVRNLELDLQPLIPVLDKYSVNTRSDLIPLLLEAQGIYGYLPSHVVEVIGMRLRIPFAEIYGVIEFYTMLYTAPTAKTIVRICTSPMCAQLGGEELHHKVCEHLQVGPDGRTEDAEYMVERVECLGLCDHAPAALIGDISTAYDPGQELQLWLENPVEVPFGKVGGKPRWLTQRCGTSDPIDIQSYESQGGFAGIRRALKELSPAEVIGEIKSSGLSGRGGAAFPTGLKWEYTAAAPGETRYVICNADESEPGTFKDRALLEGDPYSVLEGMLIAGYAIGAEQGYIFIRGEYPRVHRILSAALDEAYQAGWLGQKILGSDFTFQIEIRSGAGAYICGEETALFESIEGKRGFPRLKPPFPTTHGLFGAPTVINNVETFGTAAWILANGVDAYHSVGTDGSPGTKLFCLSGDVHEPGVYEAPFGIQLGKLIEMAGGVQGELQAILLGGAAGAFAGPDELDVPMSFEGMKEAGLPLGSGVVSVINSERDMGLYLHSLAKFFVHESCGKCFPCQLGTQRQLEIISRWRAGEVDEGDLQALRDVGFAMTYASLCGLGMTANSAIHSAFEKWPDLWA